MKQVSPQGAVSLLFAAAMVASFAAATPARAQGLGGGGGEGASWQYELYIESEAKALREKKLAESQAESQPQRDARQKAGIGIQEFDAGPIVSMPWRFVTTGLANPEHRDRGK